ncbi:MAG TPA: DUF5916 domain-containing protein [Pyrinomonadaceae bacterium]
MKNGFSLAAALCVGAAICVLGNPAAAQTPAARALAASRIVADDYAPSGTAAASALPVRRIASLRAAETLVGSRVTITFDTPITDYTAARDGGRFLLRVPRAAASFVPTALVGSGFTEVSVERQRDDLLFTFTLEPATGASVRQSFNRLEVNFVRQAAAQGQQQGSAAQPAPTPAPAGGNPAPASGQTQPADSIPTTTSEEVKATEGKSATALATDVKTPNAGRVNLPPEKAVAVAIRRFDKPPVIDGKLDDEVWKRATIFKDFIQYRPVDLVAPSKPTEAFIGYDSKFIYVAFHAFDEPGKVRATIAKRDAIFDDDTVGIFLDTFDDGRRAYELFFNPLGVQADATFVEGVSEDFSTDIVMESKGALSDDGYVVEVAIPFKSLRYVAGKDKKWGLHLLRTIKRFNNEQSSWMPISKDNSSILGQRGHLTGLEGVSTERTLELIPSLTVSQEGQRVRTVSPLDAGRLAGGSDTGRFLNRPAGFDPGLSAKYTITPQVTLDFTYNPDFAQVEADATVVTANQRFPIFFQEKRPFFLEGKEIFETLISAVHTRAIVDPDYAVKLTGRQGRNTFGVLYASDKAPGNLNEEQRDFVRDTRNPFEEREAFAKILDKNATVGILRFKRDFGQENHIGLLATTYNFIDQYNHVAGADARFRLNKTTTFTTQVLGSVTHRPFFYAEEGGVFDRKEKGMAYSAFINMNGRNWGYEAGITGRSKFFRADVGFNRRFDTNNPVVFVRYQASERPKNWLVSWRVFNGFNSNFDWKGRHQRYNNETQLQLRLQRQTWLGVGVEEGYERVFEEEFGPTRAAQRLVVERRFSSVLAAGLPACDQFGTLPPPVADDPETPENEELRVPFCTFYGADTERSVNRKSLYAYAESAPSKKYSFNLFTSYNWGVIDLDFGTSNPSYPRVSPAALTLGGDAPLDPGRGNEWFLEMGGAYQPTDALRVSLNYTKNRLTRNDTGLVAFDDNIFSLRGTYQFTRFWFARARADYTTLGSRMRMQYLVGWAPNPGTNFYVGYNDDLNRNGLNPFTSDLEPGFRRNGRLFFIKMSYLFRRSF